jgi:signal transduction histidine kinase
MKRLNILLTIFTFALLAPLSWLILQTYSSFKQEEISQLRFFATELFARMEDDLAARIYREEARAVDAYQTETNSPLAADATVSDNYFSPLSLPSEEAYILGYFQNNPDGSFSSPYVPSSSNNDKQNISLDRLKSINTIFNQKKYRIPEKTVPVPNKPSAAKMQEKTDSFAKRYINSKAQTSRSKTYLGRKEKRTEEITVSQAINLQKKEITSDMDAMVSAETESASANIESESTNIHLNSKALASSSKQEALKVEVTPFQAVGIDPNTLFIFRRVILQNQVYRQGFVLSIEAFLQHLADTFFLSQPMAEFTQLTFTIANGDTKPQVIKQFGTTVPKDRFNLRQTFPTPFDFLTVKLTCQDIPISAVRQTLNWIVAMLIIVVLIGFFSIYQAVRSVVELSERRSQFVSSVTHELKTPLTNINLYIEMLEQGIGRNKSKEMEYYQILRSESTRLSGLISNVLELSRLEKKQRSFNLQKGMFEEVLNEIKALFSARLKQKDYDLTINTNLVRPFVYDRDVMLQVLTNLIENSLKFAINATLREIQIDVYQTEKKTCICVSDHGPGIPDKSLKKIFDDFYRGTQPHIQTIPGTGIGLSLVRKFITAMGGQVTAKNRKQGSGCIILITLPL